MFTKNGNILKINGSWLNPHNEPEPVVLYDYMTFKAIITADYTFDQAGGCAKVYTNSYMKNLDDNTTAALVRSSDYMYWNLVDGITYMCYWADEDIETTKNYSISSWNNSVVAGGVGYSGPPNGAIGELYSMDFWHKSKWSSWNMYNCTLIPQDYRNIHRGEELTDCSNLFKNAPITNSIEKFIKAMQIACPNLTTTTGCFSGCTTAPDYSYCLTKYPGWF